MMLGNPLLPVLGELNAAFGGGNPRVRSGECDAFAPGKPLGPALASVLDPAQAELNSLLAAYVSTMPGGFRETLRSIIHYALTSEVQVLLNFSWTPAYDWELTMCEIVEPAPYNSGIQILLKGRYPDESTRFPALAS
jgi:hypothetical protein